MSPEFCSGHQHAPIPTFPPFVSGNRDDILPLSLSPSTRLTGAKLPAAARQRGASTHRENMHRGVRTCCELQTELVMEIPHCTDVPGLHMGSKL